MIAGQLSAIAERLSGTSMKWFKSLGPKFGNWMPSPIDAGGVPSKTSGKCLAPTSHTCEHVATHCSCTSSMEFAAIGASGGGGGGGG